MKRAILTTAAIAAVLLIGANVQAADNTFTNAAGGNTWNTAGNWSRASVPDDTDNAVIPSGQTCNVNIAAAEADSVKVEGTLNIPANTKLTLDGSTNSTSFVSGLGRIYLQGSASELNFTTTDQTISYGSSPGEIIGLNDSAIISVDDDPNETLTELTNKITISGSLTIAVADATFDNDGIVRADRNNGAGDQKLTCVTGTYTGSSTGTYKVTASGSTLLFSSTITDATTGLATNFEVVDGTLDIDVDVSTTGDLSFTGGRIEVDDDAWFRINQ